MEVVACGKRLAERTRKLLSFRPPIMLQSTVKQTVLPSQPPEITCYEPTKPNENAPALALLGQDVGHPVAVAIAIRPSTNYAVVSFACGTTVVNVPSSLPTAGAVVSKWSATVELVGFHFERIAPQIRNIFKSDISGRDILRATWSKDRISTPGFAAKSIFKNADPFVINKWWHGVIITKGGVDKNALSLRSWLTAL
jgi:hypothetical protein